MQSRVVLFRLGYFSFDISVYMPCVFQFRTFRLVFQAYFRPELLLYFSFYELSSLMNELRFHRRLEVPSIKDISPTRRC